jgi:four helix bundle protein
MASSRKHGAEGLRVYDLALRLTDQAEMLVRGARCSRSLGEQLIRAADSVVLNIAEGAAHHAPRQKLRHYRIAHASAGECLAAIELVRRRDRNANPFPARRNAHLVSVMLCALIKQQENRAATK